MTVSRRDSPTPYAGMIRVRFEGLPVLALSARCALPCRTGSLYGRWGWGGVWCTPPGVVRGRGWV